MENEKGEEIAVGKTKIIWSNSGNVNQVLIESKPDITAEDGVKKDILEGKDILATTTTCNVFTLLNSSGIKTHFLKQVDEKTFLARRVRMIPIKIVQRRLATGSYLERNLDVAEGFVFEELISELFLKDDAQHDPLMVWNNEEKGFDIYDPQKPLSAGKKKHLSARTALNLPFSREQVLELEEIGKKVFLVLEKAWAKEGVTLVDFKIECGFDYETGELLVADVIDNDSWRLWPDGDKSQKKDKDVYRQAEVVDEAKKDELKKNYKEVALATGKFVL
ncbi:MAG: phosphoribosylaminoimidazolesuccinocarboxamide synthase [Patescibacteria group bacterium]|nr:phosphoribosylaminoimidazolesuccinocarboxamide synthase [Patescibacteria group bacterium]MDD5490950.1 phosphoribosylaminoimidazolesuccinocarboxamide synthase [Patescibacteria group bacterium]